MSCSPPPRQVCLDRLLDRALALGSPCFAAAARNERQAYEPNEHDTHANPSGVVNGTKRNANYIFKTTIARQPPAI